MKIYSLQLGELHSNCYIIETSPKQCVAVDIGGDSQYFLRFLESENLRLTKILLTHGHYDHIGGVEEVRKATGAEVFIHDLDSHMLSSERFSLAAGISRLPFRPVTEFTAVTDECYINDGSCSFRVLHTPGHSAGSVCYICEDVIFSGDTLFHGSIGRTDFEGSNPIDMRNSLRQLSLLEGDYKVLPGHNEPTTLGCERITNPYMNRG